MSLLRTSRLILEPIDERHEKELHLLHTDPFVVASIFNGLVPTIEETRMKLALYREAWQQDGFGFWMIYEGRAGSGVLMGRSGLRRFAGTEDVELGHCFLLSASGRGVAVEAGRAIAEHALSRLGLPKLVAIINPANERAIKAAAKLGLRLVDQRDHQGKLKSYFELTREDLKQEMVQ